MSPNSSTRALHALSRMQCADLTLLLEVSSELAGSLDIDEVLQTAIESATRVLGLETGAIYLREGDEVVLGATTPPLPDEFPDAFRRELLGNHPHLAGCMAQRDLIVVADWTCEQMSEAERAVCEARNLRSILFVPLLISNEAVGAFIVGSVGEPHEFSDQDIEVCRALSHEIGLALANARLYESLEQSHRELEAAYDATLEGWSLALELRDDETQGHALRVSTLSVELGRRVGIAEDELVHVRRGALLHDIGKLVVPDAILHKPGPLTDDEWVIMRKHPENGRSLLAKIPYLEPALDIPYCHHECWDGTGYPQGLSGEEIPLAARVFAVVDNYDALTSNRPYRAARSHEEAIAYIGDRSGSHFDPTVAREFLALMREPRWSSEIEGGS